MFTFEKPLPAVYGLAFDVEKSDATASGFVPATYHRESEKELFADVRLEGFAELLRRGFADKLIIVGRVEPRYPAENIAQPWAILQMLTKDLGIRGDRIQFLVSSPGTRGNIALIRDYAAGQRIVAVSNHFHIPRAAEDFAEWTVPARLLPAESFLLLDGDCADIRHRLVTRFGGCQYAERVVEECQGIADKLRGKYTPRAKT